MRKLGTATAAMLVAALATFPAVAETIPIIVKDTTAQYWQTVLAGAHKAGKDLGINVPTFGAQSEADIAGQISALENATSSSPPAIVIAPTQFSALGQPITQAAKDTKVVMIDSGASTNAATSFLTTDNVKGGAQAADALGDAIKAKNGSASGDVAVIVALPGVGSLDARVKGFKQELASKYPDLKIIAVRIADGQVTTGLNIANDLLTAHPNLAGMFAANLPMSQGSSQAVAEVKPAKLSLVCFDSDDKLVRMLKSGVVSALVVQDPFKMGYEGVRIAHDAAHGKAVPKDIDTGVNVITKDNVDSAKSKALLDPDLG